MNDDWRAHHDQLQDDWGDIAVEQLNVEDRRIDGDIVEQRKRFGHRRYGTYGMAAASVHHLSEFETYERLIFNDQNGQIGRASWRERRCKYEENRGVAFSLNQKKKKHK